MKLYLKLHFLAVAISIFFGAYRMAMGSTNYQGIFKIALAALACGLVMKAYEDYIAIQKNKNA